MSTMTEKMSQAGAENPKSQYRPGAMPSGGPKKGERFICRACGMEIEVAVDCHCDNPNHVHFECCGQTMQAV